MQKKFKRHRATGLFDHDLRLSKLSKLGDPLERLAKGVDFEQFRQLLEDHLIKPTKGKGGRPPYDYVLMFKILILQRYYNLSDDQIEYQINDRLSFMRFLGLTMADDVPDSKTVWAFTEQLTDLELVDALFNLFTSKLSELGLIVNEGKIVDASFVEAPRQRNSREENQKIKDGQGGQLWQDATSKKSQKDIDARWTKKNNVNFYGYKNHCKVDSGSKLIETYAVTDASVHDSQALPSLLNKEQDSGQTLHADSAYHSQGEVIDQVEMEDQVHEKGFRNNPLSESQKASNKEKSSTRARIEHVFGFMENSMGTMFYRKIGKKRAETVIGLINLTYNMFRMLQLRKI